MGPLPVARRSGDGDCREGRRDCGPVNSAGAAGGCDCAFDLLLRLVALRQYRVGGAGHALEGLEPPEEAIEQTARRAHQIERRPVDGLAIDGGEVIK